MNGEVQNRITGHGDEAPDQLLANPLNFRRHPSHQMDALRGSIRELGWVKTVLVNKRTGYVLDGHARVEEAVRQKLATVPVTYVDLSPEEERLALAVLDPITEIAIRDQDALAALLADVTTTDAGLQAFLATLGQEPETTVLPGADMDDVGEPPADPVTKPGDLIVLGRHRLLCGDSTKIEDVERVMNGQRAAVCITDPPYGPGGKKESGKNDYDVFVDTQENLKELADGWLPLARTLSNAVVFSPGVTNAWIYPPADWIMCWFYGGGQLRSSWGFNCWQPFLCYGKDPSLATGNGGRPDAVNMNTPANSADLDHPCPKPVDLWEWMLDRLSFGDDDIIFEPFGGSGTTFVACQSKNRKCYGIELSPRYCDVIVNRWEKVTGQKAQRPEAHEELK